MERGVTALSARLRLSSSSSTSADQSLTPDTSRTLPLLSSRRLSSDPPQLQLELSESGRGWTTSLTSSGSRDLWNLGGRLAFTSPALARPDGGLPLGSQSSSFRPEERS